MNFCYPLDAPTLSMSGNVCEIRVARLLAKERGEDVVVKQLMAFNGMQRTQWARPDGSLFTTHVAV